jgi:MFS family permease
MNAQMFIRGYLVFELTGSYAMLGVISLANALPGIVFSLVGGVVADRVRSKKRLVQILQTFNVANTLAIGLLLAFGALDVWHLVAAAALQGGVMSLMMPSRQVLTQEVVGMDRLMNALALNTAGMNVNRLIMPAAAGGLMAALGGGTGIEGAQYVYFLMCGMYLMSMVTLHFVVAPDVARSRGYSLGQAVGELVDGFAYARRDRVVLMLLIVNLLVVMGSMPYLQLLPGFAKSVLGTDAGSLGLLMSIQGIGSLAGSLVIASLPNRNRGRVLLIASSMVGVTLILFSASTLYWLSALILIAVGVAQAGRMALGQVLIQTYTEDQYRGRVQSIYFMEMSLMQFGTFGVGLLANVIGPQWAIGGTAGMVLIVSVFTLLFVPRFRNLA